MDERTERLLQKAEDAIDRNDTDQADSYAMLASRVILGHTDLDQMHDALMALNHGLEHDA